MRLDPEAMGEVPWWWLPVVSMGSTVGVCLLFMFGYWLVVLRPRFAKYAKRAEEEEGEIADQGSYSLKTRRRVGEGKLTILYATVKGASKDYAEQARHAMTEVGWTVTLSKISDEGKAAISGEDPVLIVVPTYEDGKPPASCANFMIWLEDKAKKDGLKLKNNLRYTILGLGHSDYSSNGTFNKAGKDMHKLLRKAGARPFGPGVVLGDEGKHTQDAAFAEWLTGVKAGILDVEDMQGVGVYEVGMEADETKSDDDEHVSDSDDGEPDMEDMLDAPADPTAEMVNPRTRKALTKQGYTIIGSHSGVKICRWTKAQLRGRGGCYKHSFYGITSYQCMEMTPSLACANKCTFCWRHHTNPVAKEWKWKTDDPEFLVSKAIEGQRAMIKPLKGVPGVQPDRFEDAMNPRHCALSLVGEPIIYPEINTLLDKLHERRISSFMVTNAQFPEAIETLKPVTQMYISVDAATKDTMKAIDRPIFDDFWERFLAGVDAMRKKGQRTVFRLTLVKERNMTEIENYAGLIQRGNPDFVEVKGVTWCGESSASNMRMSNVPFHKEVVEFCTLLAKACGPQYELASEHEHSCCILIAKTSFKKADGWHTWIDFDKFHELLDSGKPFTSTDYLVRTPDWAQYGNGARGFDPEETRYVKVRNHPGRQQAQQSQ